MQKLWFYSNERLQFGTGDKASDAQRNRLGHSRINACGDGAGSSVDETRGSSLLEGEYVTFYVYVDKLINVLLIE